jgi:hypothetical protein
MDVGDMKTMSVRTDTSARGRLTAQLERRELASLVALRPTERARRLRLALARLLR